MFVSRQNKANEIRCACDHEHNRCDSTKLDYCTTNKTCFAAVVRDSVEHDHLLTFGCLSSQQPARLSCNVGTKLHVSIQCCNDEDYCNRRLQPIFADIPSLREESTTETEDATNSATRDAMYGLIALVLILTICALLVWRFLNRKKMMMEKRGSWVKTNNNEDVKIGIMNNLTPQFSCTSGSGSGLPLLCQRTVARSITLQELIGKGRYGQVWKGCYQGESVAVKMFDSRSEASWKVECFIFATVVLRHDNVLTFIAADTISRCDSATQLWIVTKYHKNGSLFDFLNRQPISVEEAVVLLTTAASGLSYLHQRILGSQGKPAIAHRDVKSRNLLVTDNLHCCVADLGLALVDSTTSDAMTSHLSANQNQANYCLLQRPQLPNSGQSAVAIGSRSRYTTSPSTSSSHATALTSCEGGAKSGSCDRREGTRRYMPPEVISGKIDCSKFESFKRGDVYSFGLVVWETLNRVTSSAGGNPPERVLLGGNSEVGGYCNDYVPPFGDLVPEDPTIEDMERVVCDLKLRPPVESQWVENPVTCHLVEIMSECWQDEPEARLTMLRIKKSLQKLLPHIE